MYKYLLPILVLIIAASSCNKNLDSKCPVVNIVAPDSEMTALNTYIDTSHITATKDPRGFYYSIIDSGIGQYPTACNAIQVNYTGKLTSGKMFDSGHNTFLSLQQLITGWQEGLPLIRKGGQMLLYLPPSLGYGAATSDIIPANSILIFSIELVGVK